MVSPTHQSFPLLALLVFFWCSANDRGKALSARVDDVRAGKHTRADYGDARTEDIDFARDCSLCREEPEDRSPRPSIDHTSASLSVRPPHSLNTHTHTVPCQRSLCCRLPLAAAAPPHYSTDNQRKTHHLHRVRRNRTAGRYHVDAAVFQRSASRAPWSPATRERLISPTARGAFMCFWHAPAPL